MSTIKPEDFARIRTLSALLLAPSGKKAVFSLTTPNLTENCYHSCLWLYDFRTEEIRRLTGGGSERSFCFLDDETILFPALFRGEDRTRVTAGEAWTVFYRLSLTGAAAEPEEVFRVPLANATARLLCDSRYLIAAVRNNARPNIEAMPAAEREKALAEWKLESEWEVCDELPFVADGRGFVGKKRHSLWIYNAACSRGIGVTGAVTGVGGTCEPGAVSGVLTPLVSADFEVSHSTVSPDGSQIAYAGVAYDRLYIRAHGIYRCDVAARETTTLVEPDQYQIMGLAFLESGLAVAAAPWSGVGPFPNHHLYLIPDAGGRMQLMHEHTDEDFGQKTVTDSRLGSGITFQGRGNTLFYITSQDTYSYLNAWSPGTPPFHLSTGEYSVDFFAAGEHEILIAGFGENRLPELSSLDCATGRHRVLTGFNREYLAEKRWVKPVRLCTKSRDGTQLNGYVMQPAGFDPQKQYPAVLQIHGGPRANYSFLYNHEMQSLCADGYFVFYCNPRGSAGRGEAFADIQGRRGSVDYDDVMDWTDFVLDQYPQIDKTRVGVTGGSYGGYLTNWIIGHTDRFAAAVSARSIADVIGSYGVTDYSVWGSSGAYGGTPWDNPEKLWDQSPFKYVTDAVTPTLFIHAFEDYRCSISGAMQMYAALQVKGVPTRMCLFRKEGHELSRSGKPRNRLRRLREICAWMDRYLKPAMQH